jgi:hypothetical protein
VFTQEPLHLMSGETHWKLQVDAVQEAAAPGGAWQVFPQRPQFSVFVARSTQAPLHDVNPPVQPPLHVPPEHTSPVAQAVAHAPQWLTSAARSTHAVPHGENPGAHV